MRKLTVIIALFIAVAFMPGQVDAATKPGKIKTITAEKTTSSVTLKWSKAKKAKKYSIYKNGRKIKVQKARKYTASRLKANTVYRFKVQAVNGAKKGKAKTITVRTKAEKTSTVTKKPTTTNETNSNWDYTNGSSDSSTTQVESISFNKSSISLVVGDYETLYLKYNPTNAEGKNATFDVFNKNVAKVQTSGTTSVSIKAVKAGKTTIEAKCNGKTTRCSIVVKEEGQDGLKYTYEVYKLKEGTIYSSITSDETEGTNFNKFVILTTNPDPTNVRFNIVDNETGKIVTKTNFAKPSTYKEKWNFDYKDMNIPDNVNGKNVYIATFHFEKEGKREYYIEEKTNNNVTGTSSISNITTNDYNKKYNEWINGYLNKYSVGSPKERMNKITNELKNKAKYECYNMYDTNNSLKLASLPNWVSYYWDSSYHAPIIDIAKKLGATTKSGSGYYHYLEYVTFADGTTESYTICPDSNTADDISIHEKTLTINDYECVATFK